jgi:hypothetical protein
LPERQASAEQDREDDEEYEDEDGCGDEEGCHYPVLDGQPIDDEEYLGSLFGALMEGSIDAGFPVDWSGEATTEEAILIIRPGVVEFVGGASDGTQAYFGYAIDAINAHKVLNAWPPDTEDRTFIDFCTGADIVAEDGPSLIILGVWKGKPVEVRFCSFPNKYWDSHWFVNPAGQITARPIKPEEDPHAEV